MWLRNYLFENYWGSLTEMRQLEMIVLGIAYTLFDHEEQYAHQILNMNLLWAQRYQSVLRIARINFWKKKI